MWPAIICFSVLFLIIIVLGKRAAKSINQEDETCAQEAAAQRLRDQEFPY